MFSQTPKNSKSFTVHPGYDIRTLIGVSALPGLFYQLSDIYIFMSPLFGFLCLVFIDETILTQLQAMEQFIFYTYLQNRGNKLTDSYLIYLYRYKNGFRVGARNDTGGRLCHYIGQRNSQIKAEGSYIQCCLFWNLEK